MVWFLQEQKKPRINTNTTLKMNFTNRSSSMQRIIPQITVEPKQNRSKYSDLDSIGRFIDTDNDSDTSSITSESRQSVASTAPSENNRGGKSDRKVVGALMRRASSRVSTNALYDKFGADYRTSRRLPDELTEQHTKDNDFSMSNSQRFTGAELGSIQDVLVRYESKAYDLLARGRHDRALQTCKQLRALIRRLANEGVVDNHCAVAGAGSGEIGDGGGKIDKGTSILLQLYAMAVESEAFFLNGKLKRAKKRLLEMDQALAKLSLSTDKPLSQLPRAVRCAVACYTMLGNLFSLEARRMRLKTLDEQSTTTTTTTSTTTDTGSSKYSEENYNSTLDLSVESFRHAVKLRKEEGGNPGFGHTLLGEVLVVQGNFVEATSEFQQALECALRFGTGTSENQEIQAVQERRNLGDVLLIRNNYAASLSQYTACVHAMSIDCLRVPSGSPEWRSEMLAQAAVCTTISACLRALGNLDQCHAILEEAEKLVLESGAIENPHTVLHGTDSQISMKSPVRNGSRPIGSPSRTWHSSPNRLSHISLNSSLPDEKGSAMKSNTGMKHIKSRQMQFDQENNSRQMRLTSIGVTTGEASLELLVRIAVSKGHAFLRGGEWKAALDAYQGAETKLDMKADNGVQVLDPIRAAVLRGSIIMFLGDVFAFRISKLIEMEQKHGVKETWQNSYDETKNSTSKEGEGEKEEDNVGGGAADGDGVAGDGDGDGDGNEVREVNNQVRYSGQDLYARSMECYEQSYYMACDVTDNTDPYRITCLSRIGQLHSLCKRWDRALPVLQRCLEQTKNIAVIHRQLRAGLSVAVADVLWHGADIQQHEAITLYNYALQLYHDSCGSNSVEMGAAYLGIGRIWTSRGDHNSALRYYRAAATVSRTQFGKNHDVSLHVRVQVAQALRGIGENRKALEIVQDVLERVKIQEKKRKEMKKRRERDRNKGVVVVEASTIGGVTSLLYGWNGCKPDIDLCRELLKRLIYQSKKQRR